MKLSFQTFQSLIVIYKMLILGIIIGDVHRFIGHCLIPLDTRFLRIKLLDNQRKFNWVWNEKKKSCNKFN